MAYIELPQVEIRIDIPNLVIDNTVIKREAYCSKMEYNLDAKTVIVFWIVQHFSALEDGNKGEYLGDYIPDYTKHNIADSNTFCDVVTGLPIEVDENIDYTNQFDFFANMGQMQPIIVNDIIKQYGLTINDWKK